jgi:aldehyde dehydrogenase (NAD+)
LRYDSRSLQTMNDEEYEMRELLQFYIDGEWVDPETPNPFDVINPATEEVCGRISLGSAADVDKAVAAANRAAPGFARTTRDERIALLTAILEVFERRNDEVATAIMEEMGAPWKLAKYAQAPSGSEHVRAAIDVLKDFEFAEMHGTTQIVKEPIGPCALITPWNWPINQIAVKVAPALAAGCTMVLKPSEIAPFDAMLFAEILHEAGVPALVNGDGPTVGEALSSHPDIAMVSFTGSTRAGVSVAQNAAATVKRVAQELGGKSANIILDDADFATSFSTTRTSARQSGAAPAPVSKTPGNRVTRRRACWCRRSGSPKQRRSRANVPNRPRPAIHRRKIRASARWCPSFNGTRSRD